jgi:hypothetical protein
MKHVMIDLETLGTQPGSVILSIGAVIFDPTLPSDECMGETLYRVVSTTSCIEHGLQTSQDTLDWWNKQSPEAWAVIDQANDNSNPATFTLHHALSDLSDFLPAGVKVWSNGANFDQPLLDVAYDRVKLALPWKYWNSRCYRTVVALHPNEKALRPATVLAHNALEDAKWQATHMVNIARLLELKL